MQAIWRWVWLCLVGLMGCAQSAETVVIYTSVDQPFSEPILAEYERRSGVDVRVVYDVEAAKTTGLVQRLIAEQDRPQADVFWNSEVLQTLALKEAGVLTRYVSAEAAAIDPAFRDPDGYWTGIGGRARVLLVNSERVPDSSAIDSLDDLADPAWQAEAAIAYPLFGTTATHAAALYSQRGSDDARAFFRALADGPIQVVDGNSVVRDLVADGSVSFGLTDTDDACGAVARGAPVRIIFPDQAGDGTLIIPGSVALIAGGPHPQQAQALIDYLLSATVEQMLLDANFIHMPLHEGLHAAGDCLPPNSTVRSMTVDFAAVYALFAQVQDELRTQFVR